MMCAKKGLKSKQPIKGMVIKLFFALQVFDYQSPKSGLLTYIVAIIRPALKLFVFTIYYTQLLALGF